MIQLLIALAAAGVGYLLSRNFVRRRLRFVDAVQSPFMPVVTGVLATLVFLPLSLLPMVSLATAILFGIGTALGTASGARAIRHQEGEQRRLTP
ncbi:MAG TPA: hypothetical protein VH763_16685 [Gemmatimonadales bacterium]|jgi:hypothetical protein